jgi:hypothetical protein
MCAVPCHAVHVCCLKTWPLMGKRTQTSNMYI